jgi:hypothetical protein
MHRYTLPVTPGAIIGYLRNGTPVRLQAGGSEPTAEPAVPAPPADPPVPAAPATQPPAGEPAPAAPATAGTPAGDGAGVPSGTAPSADTIEALPPWAQKIIRETRTEAAASRTKAKEHSDALAALQGTHQSQLDGIAKALGLKPEEATPEQIMAERDAAHARAEASAAAARSSAVELAVFRAASQAGVNAGALLDSRTFVSTLDGLDPADQSFAQAVADKIAAAVETNPAWKAPVPAAAPAGAPQAPPLAPVAPQPPAIPASGPQGAFQSPPPPGGRQLTEADVKAMNPQDVLKAMNAGLLQQEGFGPSRAHQR